MRLRVSLLVTTGLLLGMTMLPGIAAAEGIAPKVEWVAASHVTETGATLEAEIDPEGVETTYEFWAESAACQKAPPGSAECDAIEVRHVGSPGLLSGERGQCVSVTMTDLQPGYEYHYWVVAGSVNGTAEDGGAFTTPEGPVAESMTIVVRPCSESLPEPEPEPEPQPPLKGGGEEQSPASTVATPTANLRHAANAVSGKQRRRRHRHRHHRHRHHRHRHHSHRHHRHEVSGARQLRRRARALHRKRR
ncbi:MAG TPA: hypothetical protein VGF95_14080 [Solirubrobacteraceae bacterium]